MEKMIEYIVRNLVNNQDAVTIESTQEDDVNVITVKVAEEDVGKVIGKNGKIAQSLRTILRSASSKTGKKHILKIN